MSDTSVTQQSLVIRSAIVASIGGLIFGFDTAVISGTTTSLERVYSLTSSGLGFTVAIATIGTIVGAIFAGQLADKYGRRKMLFVIGAFYLVGALGTALAPEGPFGHNVFMLFRFLGGIGVGMSSVCAPIYTAEIAPPAQRGRLVGLVQFNIVLGILLAYLSNFIIRQIVAEETAGREAQAVQISRQLCKTVEESDLQISEIRAQLQQDAAARATKVPFFTKRYRKVILMAFAIAMFNQLSGVNAILYYAPVVMQQAGASDNASYLMSVAVGFMNLVATMTALTVIDRIGRRSLMFVGSIGYLISLGFLTIIMFTFEGRYNSTSSVLVLIGLLVFIAAHAFGQGSVIWVFISEIFPNRVRARGQSFGSLTHWTFAALTTYAFPPIVDKLGGGIAFAIFFVFMCGQLLWVQKVMPETKGVPLEEMSAKLGLEQ